MSTIWSCLHCGTLNTTPELANCRNCGAPIVEAVSISDKGRQVALFAKHSDANEIELQIVDYNSGEVVGALFLTAASPPDWRQYLIIQLGDLLVQNEFQLHKIVASDNPRETLAKILKEELNAIGLEMKDSIATGKSIWNT